LKLFINEIYLGQKEGHPIKGFEDASHFYFNKKFKEVSWDEYLALIGMINAPTTYSYSKSREANQDRVLKIKRMLTGEYEPVDNSDLLYDRR
jgi:membrane peptidoglycan carboxypeptidase